MRAAVLEAYDEPLAVRDRDPPTPDPDGAVVAVEACGICRSDWHAWQGHGDWADDDVPIGQVLGHEPAGRVVETGDRVTTVSAGDRVVVPFNLGDGTCGYCRNGHGNVCTGGWALGFESDVPGAFAERVAVPQADYNLVGLPDSVDFDAAAALGCRYVTAFHALAHRADIAAGDRVAVHGCGGLGLAAVQIASALGASVIAVDIREDPLAMARDVGANTVVDASAVADVPAAIEAETDGGAEVSVDALGRAETCRNSVRCLRPRGAHVQVGLTTDAERGEVALPTDWITRWDIDVLGSRGMPPSRYDDLLRLVADGTLNPGALVTRRVALEAVSERLAAMTDYGTDGIELVTEFGR
ncbi:alcohol dehydrogenase [Haloarcula sp. Atlit-47R]|uniref:zinc-dependent alcohol dehydrogenase family protein n=1 Tax=Haloarcula sp. Atlit-47R TaxID=2282132 RepID=UPI000EF20742|nr:zinc-dependent alcohol dehydrogenase family protein [Haloarcula sp. Atlit-47R]RLM47700.1 alcohol dehydrogenase [Haloarcula sp. Atlit-47R]